MTDFYDDEASLFSESNAETAETSDTSDEEVTRVGTLKDTTEANNVENGVNSTAPTVGNGKQKGQRRIGEGRGRKIPDRVDRRRGGSAFRRGQLMLIKRLIRALKRRRQKLLRGRDGGGTA